MADPLLLKRVASRLREVGEATPKGEGFWPALAEVAAEECARAVTVEQLALPALPFAALVEHREGYRLLARGAVLLDLYNPVTTYFEEGGKGPVWLAEVRRVLGVTT